jgi:hypothetical protein
MYLMFDLSWKFGPAPAAFQSMFVRGVNRPQCVATVCFFALAHFTNAERPPVHTIEAMQGKLRGEQLE